MENKVKAFVKSLGISPELIGFRYIVESIMYIKKLGAPSSVYFTVMYKDLGEKYNTTPAAFERCIRQAINTVFASEKSLDNVRGILKFPFSDGTTTNSKFLALCADMVDEVEW